MELDDDHIKKLFSSKLEHYEVEVPEAVWSKIEKKLIASSTTPAFVVSKNTLGKKIQRMVVASASIAAMIIALLYLLPEQNDNIPSTSMLSMSSKIDSDKSDKDLHLYSSHRAMANGALPKNVDAVANSYTAESDLDEKQVAQASTSDYSEANKHSIVTGLNVIEDGKANVSEIDLDNKDRDNKSILANTSELDNEIASKIEAFKKEGDLQNNILAQVDNGTQKHRSEKLELGLNGGSSVSSSNQFNKDYSSPYSDNYLVSLRSAKTNMEHNQPITFGITISKQLSNKLSIESGITYAYLSSKLGAGETNVFRKRNMQYFHYLGIPLTLNYSFAQWNKFVFYSSLGGMIQKDLWGRRTTYTYIGSSNSEYSTKEKISQRNPQFSIHGGLGTSYPIYDKLRIYTKIGAAYYIANNNEYETIYSDRKWLFNFNLGLRFEF